MKLPSSTYRYVITDENNKPLVNRNKTVSFFRSISETQFICDVLNDIFPNKYKPTYALMMHDFYYE